MIARGLVRILVRDKFVLATVVILAAIVGVIVWRSWIDRSFHLRLSAGRPQGPRHLLAEQLVPGAKSRKISLTLVASAGSESALDDLENGKIDLALIQGGLGLTGRENVRQVAALHIEPLHVLVKDEIVGQVTQSLEQLRGRTINVGEPGSGTRSLATDVLRFAGLEPDVDYRAKSLSYEELEHEESRDRLPDAVFMVSLLPSRVARTLVSKHRFQLVALPFAEAYALASLDPISGDPASKPLVVDRDHVTAAVIPAFTYGVQRPIPSESLHTLGTRLLLVANKNVPGDAVSKILETVFQTSFTRLSHPPLSPDLLSLQTEYPPHPGLLIYQERSKPLITGDLIDAFEKEVSIAAAMLGGAFFLWQWLKVRLRRMRESGFEHYILRVATIEQEALELEVAETLDLPGLLTLQDALGALKAEAIKRFADRELEGEDLLSGFLAQASDARDYLTRLILHRRDDLERRARKEKRDAAEVWREAIERSKTKSETYETGTVESSSRGIE